MRVGDQLAEVFHYHEGSGQEGGARARPARACARVAMPGPGRDAAPLPVRALRAASSSASSSRWRWPRTRSLLILDEPTTGLDATVEAEMLDLIEELRGRINAAILLITHNLGLVARLCERVGVLYAGRLVEEGPARETLHRPAAPLHHGPAALRAALRHEQDRRRAADDPRHAACPGRAAGGMRLFSALPDGEAGVQAARARSVRLAERRRCPGPGRGREHAAGPGRVLAAPRDPCGRRPTVTHAATSPRWSPRCRI